MSGEKKQGMKMDVIVMSFEDVVEWSKACEGKHSQQMAYSTFHTALTQVCFGCEKVRTSMRLK